MILLSIDTSGPACSAALLADDRLLGEIVINSALTHSVLSWLCARPLT